MQLPTGYSWIFSLCLFVHANDELVSRVDLNRYSMNERRYILYDVNHGEGFNLRRDVYMRVANLVRVLRQEGHNFILVLPPWGDLYHWQSKRLDRQYKIPWSLFFDIESLNQFVPVIEFEQYLEERRRPEIDIVYYLQSYAEGWTHWEEKWDYRPCIDHNYYEYEPEYKHWKGWFFGYDHVYTNNFHCVSIQGHASSLKPLILAENNTAKSIMFDRAETILHDTFGDIYYWQARRSMRYSKDLIDIGNTFRKVELNSNDFDDKTSMTENWAEDKITSGRAIGGPFLCIHWRRKDFVRAYSAEIPSIVGTASQIMDLLNKLELNTVFLATDAPISEIEELSSYLYPNVTMKRFQPTDDMLEKYKDGGISIIDQWICAHARYFTGSHVSTFTFRIQDDREILGFDHSTTFNRMCPDGKADCEQPSKWPLVQ